MYPVGLHAEGTKIVVAYREPPATAVIFNVDIFHKKKSTVFSEFTSRLFAATIFV